MLIDTETREIFVYGPIGEDWFDEGITAELMVQALGRFRGHDVTVRINSPGGVADEGIAIYNAMRRHDGKVTTVVDSVAASAASVIALGGSERITAKGGRWMIHRALTFAIGNSAEMRKVAGLLDTYDRSLVEIYSEYMQGNNDIEAMLDAETWFSGDEALNIGLTTRTSEDHPDVQPAVASWYRHAPAAVTQSPAAVVSPKFAVNRQAAQIRNRRLLTKLDK